MAFATPRPVRLDARAHRPGAPALTRFAFNEDADDDPFRVPLAHLQGAPEESWVGGDAVSDARRPGVVFRHDGHWLIGALEADPRHGEDIEQAAEAAYAQLRAFVSTSGYPHLLRVWNYLDRLNQGDGDAERYRRFCVGRHRVLAAPGFETQLPAATVIGSHVPGLRLQFLAARQPGVQVENPRQVSAFRYPRDYGPISPSFSRATRIGHTLLVSGTAAVVGHATRHPYDARAQLDEIAANLQALLDRAAQDLPRQHGRWAPQALRLYLRRPQDLAALQPHLEAALGTPATLSVLRGDISRADLMVEAEGVWTFQADR